MYRYDLHIHTAETSPCGNIPAVELVMLYKKSGYTGIVITDHYYPGYFHRMGNISWQAKIDRYLTGYRLAKTAGDNCSLQVFLGMEMRFADSPNDYLIYGIDEDFLYNNPELFDLGLTELRELTADKGILIFQAHPFRNGMQTPQPEHLDGIEIHNGNQRHDSRNQLAINFACEHNMPGVSGSDFHEYEDLATGGVSISHRAKDYAELLNMLLSKEICICDATFCR